MSNKDVVECVWNSVKDNKTLKAANNVHKQSGMGVEYILKNTLLRRSVDNVTVVMIAFNNFKHAAFGDSHNTSKMDGTGIHGNGTVNISKPPNVMNRGLPSNRETGCEGGLKMAPALLKQSSSTIRPARPLHQLNIDAC